MSAPTEIAQRQLDLGPAGYFRVEAMEPAANQVKVKAGYAFSGGYAVLVPNQDGDGFPQDQTSGGFSLTSPGNQRYDLVYIDKDGLVQILAGTNVAAGTDFPQGAPGWTGTNPGPNVPDQAMPLAYVLVTETGGTPAITASRIKPITAISRISRDLDLYMIDKGLLGGAPTGASDVVTSLFAGESQLGAVVAPFVVGVVTTAPNNIVEVLDQNRDAIQHTSGARVYGRLTYAAGVWTLTYYYLNASGAETAVTAIESETTLGSGLTNVRLYRTPKVYSRHDPNRPMFPDPISSLRDQAAGLQAGIVPLGGMIEWSPVSSPPVLPFGFEYADGTAVSTVGSPFHPSVMPAYLKPIRMKTASGGAQRFGRGADYSVGTHGADNAEPTGGTDTIPGATPATDSQGGSTPVSGTLSGSTDPASVAHTHTITADTHDHGTEPGPPNTTSTASAASQIADYTHSHGGATGPMSANDPHSHGLSSPFSATVNTAHSHTVVSHNHGGENRPAFQDVAVIIRVLGLMVGALLALWH